MIPIRCRKCGVEFTGQRRNERVCDSCKPRWQLTARAAKTAKDSGTLPTTRESQTSLAFAQVSGTGNRGFGMVAAHACHRKNRACKCTHPEGSWALWKIPCTGCECARPS